MTQRLGSFSVLGSFLSLKKEKVNLTYTNDLNKLFKGGKKMKPM